MIPDKQPLIVYIHGALSTNGCWSYIRQHAANKRSLFNQPHEEFFRYNLNNETSDEIVAQLVTKVDDWVWKKQASKVVLIGHSFGGVLAVAAMRELYPIFEDVKVKARVITLSSPFAGSGIASVMKFFKPQSKFFKNVGSHADFIKKFKRRPLASPTYSFVTTEGGADWMPQANDGVVTVSSQLHFKDDPHSTIHEVHVNHFEILMSDAVVTKLHMHSK